MPDAITNISLRLSGPTQAHLFLHPDYGSAPVWALPTPWVHPAERESENTDTDTCYPKSLDLDMEHLGAAHIPLAGPKPHDTSYYKGSWEM